MRRECAINAIDAAMSGDKEGAKFWLERSERPNVEVYIGGKDGWSAADGKQLTDAEMKARNEQCKKYGVEVAVVDFNLAQ